MPLPPKKELPGGPGYRVFSVSNLVDRDAEYWVEYDTENIKPGTQLICDGSLTYARCIAERIYMECPIAAQLADYVLMDVHSEGGTNYLIFARNTLPTFETEMTPSLISDERDTWRFPALIRSFPQPQFGVNSGNLIYVSVAPDIVDEFHGVCTIVTRQWWTSQPWPRNLLERRQGMQPDRVTWDYFGLAQGSLLCLHPDLNIPPLSGVSAIRGQALGRTLTIQGTTFPATNPPTWTDDVQYDKVQQIRGRWFREQKIVLPPFDPTLYPEAPFFYTS